MTVVLTDILTASARFANKALQLLFVGLRVFQDELDIVILVNNGHDNLEIFRCASRSNSIVQPAEDDIPPRIKSLHHRSGTKLYCTNTVNDLSAI